MSADLLRQAAAKEREDWGGADNARTYPHAAATHLAIADWLDLTARRLDEGLGYPGDYEKPLNVARLIVGGEQ